MPITSLIAKPPYDPLRDFSFVSVFANSSTTIVIHPSVPAANLRELIAYAKANPRKLSYGSAGNGSISQFRIVAQRQFDQLDLPLRVAFERIDLQG